jgi:hypothetical protein
MVEKRYLRLTEYYGETSFEGVLWYQLSKELAYADMKIRLN